MANWQSGIESATTSFRKWLPALAVFSLIVNLLMLTGPLFMLQIYDRVLTSGSVATLVALFALVVALYLFMGVLDFVRARVLVRIGGSFDAALGRTTALRAMLARLDGAASASEPVRDLDRLRQFFASGGVLALFDLPWVPFYVAIVFLIHPALGGLAVVGAAVLFAIAVLTDRRARPLLRRTAGLSAQRTAWLTSGARNAEALVGMGMGPSVGARYDGINGAFINAHERAADVTLLASVVSKGVRLFLQSAVLALGAYLAIQGAISAGAMIAASIIMARGLMPVESAVQNWRQLLEAQQAYGRLREAERGQSAPPGPIVRLPAPTATLSVEDLAVTPPGGEEPAVTGVRFTVSAGSAVGVIGHSGSGKSTLARALVGVWPAQTGAVLLDGAPLSQFDEAGRARNVGYLPQDVELFDGTIGENIARFGAGAGVGTTANSEPGDETGPGADAIVAAAQAAGCHEMIVAFPNGYATQIGDGGRVLSAGQRQRIALARALFGNPFLVVLDEPNSNLDGFGDSALNHAIKGAKARGAVVVVIAHRPSALSATDSLCLFNAGLLTDFGPRDEVLKKVMRQEKVASVQPAQRAQQAEEAG